MNAHVLAVTDEQTRGKVLGRGKMEMKRPTKPPDEKMIEPIFMQTLKMKLLISFRVWMRNSLVNMRLIIQSMD